MLMIGTKMCGFGVAMWYSSRKEDWGGFKLGGWMVCMVKGGLGGL